MYLVRILTLCFTVFTAPVFAGSWGGYVYHEGESETNACHEAKKHAYELCEKNGETFNVNNSPDYCKLVKTAEYNNKTIYFVNLVFSCQSHATKVRKDFKAKQ